MTVWFAKHKKAIGAALGGLGAEATALLSLGVLSGSASHDVALGLLALVPIAAFFGAKIAPPNAAP